MTQRSGIRLRAFLLMPLVAMGVVAFAAGGSKPAVEPGLRVAKTGTVLDAQTHQPLAGVYVAARWLEQSTERSFGTADTLQGQCLYRTVVRTDEQGRYAIPASTNFTIAAERTGMVRRYFWDAYAYTPGYGMVDSVASHPKSESSSIPASQALQPILLLATDHAAPAQRVDALIKTMERFTCEPYAAAPVPVAELAYAEGYAAACLQGSNEAARSLARLNSAVKPHQDEQPCAQSRQASNTR